MASTDTLQQRIESPTQDTWSENLKLPQADESNLRSWCFLEIR